MFCTYICILNAWSWKNQKLHILFIYKPNVVACITVYLIKIGLKGIFLITTFVQMDDKKEGIFNCVFYTNYHKFHGETWSILHVCFCVKQFDLTQSLLYVSIWRCSVIFDDVQEVWTGLYIYIYIYKSCF